MYLMIILFLCTKFKKILVPSLNSCWGGGGMEISEYILNNGGLKKFKY